MAKREVSYVQQLRHMKKFTNSNNELLVDELVDSLKKEFDDEEYEWAFIVHDKDKRSDEDDEEEAEPHLHFYIKRKSRTSLSRKRIKEFFNEEKLAATSEVGYGPSYLCYLVHYGFPNKHQYDIEEVKSNFAYTKEKLEEWLDLKFRKEKSKKRSKLEKKILNEDVNKHDVLINDEYSLEYASNQKKIDKLFDIVEERKLIKLHDEKFGDYNELVVPCFNDDLNKIDNNHKKVWYIFGESGSGKSLLSKALAKAYSFEKADDEEREFRTDNIYISSSSNDPFEFYGKHRKEQIIIMDEFRLSDFDKIQLLRLFDNNEGMLSFKSRFKNVILEPKVIILNSIQHPLQINKYYKNSNEDPYQFFRRMTYGLEVIKNNLDQNGNGNIYGVCYYLNAPVVHDIINDSYIDDRVCSSHIRGPRLNNCTKDVIFEIESWTNIVGVRWCYNDVRVNWARCGFDEVDRNDFDYIFAENINSMNIDVNKRFSQKRIEKERDYNDFSL